MIPRRPERNHSIPFHGKRATLTLPESLNSGRLQKRGKLTCQQATESASKQTNQLYNTESNAVHGVTQMQRQEKKDPERDLY